MKLFRVSRSYYESYQPHDLIGPEEYSKEDFEKLCDSLIPKAIDNAIKLETGQEHPSYIGWSDITEHLVKALEKHGFSNVKPIEVEYFGSDIIRGDREEDSKIPDDHLKILVDYNEKVSRRL